MDASEDDQLAAAIEASLVDTSKPTTSTTSSALLHNVYDDSDSDLVRIWVEIHQNSECLKSELQ